MKRSELTEAQKKYMEFDRRRRISVRLQLVCFSVVLLFFLSALCADAINPNLLLIYSCLLTIWAAAVFFLCRHFARRHKELYAAAHAGETDVARTGLFGEIWDEFEWNRFEGLTDGKVLSAEAFGNIIELEIIRHGHEFNIVIDENAVCMLMDDETDDPVEKNIPLSELAGLEQFYAAVREFIESA